MIPFLHFAIKLTQKKVAYKRDPSPPQEVVLSKNAMLIMNCDELSLPSFGNWLFFLRLQTTA